MRSASQVPRCVQSDHFFAAIVIVPSPLAGEGSSAASLTRMGEGLMPQPLTDQSMLELRRRPLPQGERAL
jgi:hypothetical protein